MFRLIIRFVPAPDDSIAYCVPSWVVYGRLYCFDDLMFPVFVSCGWNWKERKCHMLRRRIVILSPCRACSTLVVCSSLLILSRTKNNLETIASPRRAHVDQYQRHLDVNNVLASLCMLAGLAISDVRRVSSTSITAIINVIVIIVAQHCCSCCNEVTYKQRGCTTAL